VEVAFYDASSRLVHRNDFVMRIAPTKTVYTGPDLDEGDVLDPGDVETVDVDVRAEILANIRRYVGRANAGGRYAADYRSQALKEAASDTDPLGLRARTGVSELVNSRLDV